MGEFDDIIPEFIAESAELLEAVESGLLSMEQGERDPEVINSVFRAIHSIKGGAGFVGLVKIERLAHRMEDLLNLIRNGELEPTPGIMDALLHSLDVLKELFDRVEEHDAIDIEAAIEALNTALAEATGSSPAETAATRAQPTTASGLPAFDVDPAVLKSKLRQTNVYHLRLDMAKFEARGMSPLELVKEMLSMGEVLDSVAHLPEGDEPTPVFDVLYATVLEPDLLAAALRLEEGDYRLLSEEDFATSSPEPPAQAEPEPQAQPQPAPQSQPAQAQPQPTQAQPQPAPQSEAPPPVPASAQQPPAVAQPAVAQPLKRAGEYLIFGLGGETYGVDILMVQEIIGMPHLTRLPRSPEYVLGVMNLRGMVVPVLDLRKKLRLPEAEGEPVVMVVRVEEKIMGAVVDGVKDVVELKEEDIQDAPEFVGAVEREYLRGLSQHEGELLILLDLDRLLAPESMEDAA